MSNNTLDLAPVEHKMKAYGMPVPKIKQEISFAQQLYAASKELRECDHTSLMAAVINVANTNLTLNPIAKEATLVARWDSSKNCKVATFMPQYVGIQKSLIAEGAVTSIIANVVYENDVFELNLADSASPVKHLPDLTGNRGKVIGFYSLATLPDGSKHPEWMPNDVVEAIREKSDGYKAFASGKIKSNPWNDWYEEMGRKAVLKRHCKWLPRARGASVVDKIIELDNQDYGASQHQYGIIESLLPHAMISETLAYEVQARLDSGNLTTDEASRYIKVLKDNQPDAISHKGTGSMKEINAAVAAKLDDERA